MSVAYFSNREPKLKTFFQSRKNKSKKKTCSSLIDDSGGKATNPKEILQEEETFFQSIYKSNGVDSNVPELNHFFQPEKVLSDELAETSKGGRVRKCVEKLAKQQNFQARTV